MNIHLVRILVLRTIPGTLVVEVGINSRRVFGGGIACIASGGFFLENSRTKNSRRECRLSLWVCVPGWVRSCVRGIPVGDCVSACVCMCVRMWHDLFRRKSHTTHKNGLNSGLYYLIGIRLPKRIINANKRLKIEPYGRVRFLSVIQRAQRERK